MWGLNVAAMVVVVVMPGVGASAERPGLSWCSESSLDNFLITKDMKPELAQIEVVVDDILERDVVDEVYIRQQAPCKEITQPHVARLNGEEAELILQDGEIKLFWRVPDSLPIFQEVDEFCIAATSDAPDGEWKTFLAKFCFPFSSEQIDKEMLLCSNITCVRKCCPAGMSLSYGSLCTPVPYGEDWQPSMVPDESEQTAPTVHMLYGPPRQCGNALMYEEFSILPSGMLKIDSLGVPVDRYCVDTFHNLSRTAAMVCEDFATAPRCEWKNVYVKPVLLALSSVCLIIVWLVYISVAKLRSLNEGRCILSLVSALFVAHITLIILNVTEGENLACVVIARLCNLTLLASYFWMNVFSFHTFVQIRSQLDGKWEKPMVFCLYSLYAWGCPLVVVLVGVVLDAVKSHAIRPGTDISCWFFDEASHWAYLYIPMVVVLLVNAGFFVGCVVLLCCGRGRVTFTPSSGHHHTFSGGSAWLFFRLFILMGILWLMEVVSFATLSYCSVTEWIFDIISCLNGVLVFLVTVCCRRDLKVFHGGRPQLIQGGRHSEITGTTDETSEMTTNPLVK